MAAATKDEIPILVEFRSSLAKMSIELSPEESTDIRLLAWLRARELKVEAAAEMLKTSLDWRKRNKWDTVLNWEPPANYAKEFPYKIDGRDSEGRPLLIFPGGIWDVKGAITTGGKETWLRYTDQMFAKLQQRLAEISSELNREITQFVIIFDCEHFAYSQLMSFSSIESIKDMATRFEANHPETLYKCYLINSGRIWEMAFSILRRFMTKRTTDKIEMMSSPAKWKPYLLKQLPPDQVPREYGGLR